MVRIDLISGCLELSQLRSDHQVVMRRMESRVCQVFLFWLKLLPPKPPREGLECRYVNRHIGSDQVLPTFPNVL